MGGSSGLSGVVEEGEGRSCCCWVDFGEGALAIVVGFAVGAAASFVAAEGLAARWDSSVEGLAAVVDLVVDEATWMRRWLPSLRVAFVVGSAGVVRCTGAGDPVEEGGVVAVDGSGGWEGSHRGDGVGGLRENGVCVVFVFRGLYHPPCRDAIL